MDEPRTHPNPEVQAFLETLSPLEWKGYLIAKSQLNSTFNIEKANAYLRWRKERTATAPSTK